MATAVIKPCPLCGKTAVEQYNPFCSKRCADIDLGRWLGEQYRIETEDGAAGDTDQDS